MIKVAASSRFSAAAIHMSVRTTWSEKNLKGRDVTERQQPQTSGKG